MHIDNCDRQVIIFPSVNGPNRPKSERGKRQQKAENRKSDLCKGTDKGKSRAKWEEKSCRKVKTFHFKYEIVEASNVYIDM